MHNHGASVKKPLTISVSMLWHEETGNETFGEPYREGKNDTPPHTYIYGEKDR